MNILITGAFSCTNEQFANIEELGHKVLFMQNEADELPCDYDWVQGVIANGIFLHHDIKKFSSLKHIQLTSAGFDRVPMDYVKDKGIKIFNARGVYGIPMAEFALCGVLSIYKQLNYFKANQASHIWQKHRGLKELCNKMVLVVGAGNVGQECAKRFSAMGCDVYGADLYPVKTDFFDEVVHISKLNEKLRMADIVILTLPLTDDTRHLFDASRFSQMKNGAVFVNISRGAVVNTDDMISALNDNLGGAVLDVFETEPLDDNSPLWDMENVIITPHNSFVGEGNNKRLLNVIIKNLKM